MSTSSLGPLDIEVDRVNKHGLDSGSWYFPINNKKILRKIKEKKRQHLREQEYVENLIRNRERLIKHMGVCGGSGKGDMVDSGRGG